MPVYKRIGRMFQCSPDQIKRIVQQKDSILKAWEQRTRRCQDAKTLEMKVVRVSMLGKAVYDWIRRMMYYKDFMITDGLIQKMALQFKSAMGLQHFFPHQEWCDKFRLTYKILRRDSKLLSIGYTQGHSVQIKDIIKDVLSECTPDLLHAETNEAESGGPTAAKQPKLMPKPMKQEPNCDENSNEQNDNNAYNATHTATAANIRKLQLPQLVSLPRTCALGTHKVLVATPINTNKCSGNAQTGNANSTINGAAGSPMTMTIIPLATITQPMGNAAGNTGTQMPVAGSLIAANTKRQGRLVPPPMVEIKCEIKEERRDEEVEKQLQQQQQNQLKTATTTETLPAMPIAIKEELVSEEEEEAVVVPQMANLVANKPKPKIYLQALKKITNKLTNTTKSPKTTPTTTEKVEDDATDAFDYDNLALASLKQLMKNEAKLAKAKAAKTTSTKTTQVTTATTTATTATTNTTKTLAKLTLKTTPTVTLTPIENLRATPLPLPPMVALSQMHAVNNNVTANAASSAATQRHITVISRGSTANLPAMPPLTLQHLPPLTKAPVRAPTPNVQLPLPALIPRSVSAGAMPTTAVHNNNSSSSSINYRLASQRKMRAQRSPTPGPLAAIRTCSEARRYLKLLEDFALERENVRLIGLITRADEVVRELDGDDDVDID